MEKPATKHGHPRRTELADISRPLRWMRNRSLPLLVVLIISMLIYPWFDRPGEPSTRAIMILFEAIPFFGVLTLGPLRWWMFTILIGMTGAVFVGGLSTDHHTLIIASWPGLVVIAFYLLNIFIIARSVLRSDALLDDRVYGGIAVYILIGILFAMIHHRIGLRDPEAYKNLAIPNAAVLNWADYIYFSFSVFTTSGFGDIVATRPFSRSLSSVESIIGVLFPAVLIARLINRDFAVLRN